jgi:hypothetical protein
MTQTTEIRPDGSIGGAPDVPPHPSGSPGRRPGRLAVAAVAAGAAMLSSLLTVGTLNWVDQDTRASTPVASAPAAAGGGQAAASSGTSS